MSSIDTNKQAAYEAAYTNFATAGCSESVCEAYTNFKSHEAWGWHLMAPFKEGASVEESNTIQEGIDTYERLWAAVMGLEIPSPTPSPTPSPSVCEAYTNSYHLPYASRMRRVELEEALKPVLALLRSAC